jgi:hypothetical protein
MRQLLLIPIFLTGCAMFWTSKSFDLSPTEAWSCEDVREGARIKAYYYSTAYPIEVELSLRTTGEQLTVPLVIDEQAGAGEIWTVEQVVEGVRCGDERLGGEIHAIKPSIGVQEPSKSFAR